MFKFEKKNISIYSTQEKLINTASIDFVYTSSFVENFEKISNKNQVLKLDLINKNVCSMGMKVFNYKQPVLRFLNNIGRYNFCEVKNRYLIRRMHTYNTNKNNEESTNAKDTNKNNEESTNAKDSEIPYSRMSSFHRRRLDRLSARKIKIPNSKIQALDEVLEKQWALEEDEGQKDVKQDVKHRNKILKKQLRNKKNAKYFTRIKDPEQIYKILKKTLKNAVRKLKYEKKKKDESNSNSRFDKTIKRNKEETDKMKPDYQIVNKDKQQDKTENQRKNEQKINKSSFNRNYNKYKDFRSSSKVFHQEENNQFNNDYLIRKIHMYNTNNKTDKQQETKHFKNQKKENNVRQNQSDEVNIGKKDSRTDKNNEKVEVNQLKSQVDGIILENKVEVYKKPKFVTRQDYLDKREAVIFNKMRRDRVTHLFFLGRKFTYTPKKRYIFLLSRITGISIKRLLTFFSAYYRSSVNAKMFMVKLKVYEDFQRKLRFLMLNREVRKTMFENIAKKKKYRLYMGIRHMLNLPARGQRSKTNAGTNKRKSQRVKVPVSKSKKKR